RAARKTPRSSRRSSASTSTTRASGTRGSTSSSASSRKPRLRRTRREGSGRPPDRARELSLPGPANSLELARFGAEAQPRRFARPGHLARELLSELDGAAGRLRAGELAAECRGRRRCHAKRGVGGGDARRGEVPGRGDFDGAHLDDRAGLGVVVDALFEAAGAEAAERLEREMRGG